MVINITNNQTETGCIIVETDCNQMRYIIPICHIILFNDYFQMPRNHFYKTKVESSDHYESTLQR